MPVVIPEISVGAPVQCGGVSIFPLFHQVVSRVDYTLAQDAIAAGSVRVRELSDGTTVPYILVNNDGDMPVLFVEGEEFKGAKQNRVVNTTLMVAAGDYSIIPVTCTERGRWQRESEEFVAGAFCPPTLRYLLKEARLSIIDDATGIAVAVNEEIVCIDVFDKPETLARLWDRMVEGIALDAMDTHGPGRQASILTVMIQVCEMTELQWHRAEGFGAGKEHITDDRNGGLDTAMVVDGVVVHASVCAPVAGGNAE